MSITMTVKEKPILFRGEMVKAILDGRKTQTRRIAKRTESGLVVLKSPYAANVRDGVGLVWTPYAGSFEQPMPKGKISELCPFGSIGSRLWVREKWALVRFWTDPETGVVDDLSEWTGKAPKDQPAGWTVVRDADVAWDSHRDDRGFSWRPSIFMPRWACRLVLVITDVRVERLNNISHEDAMAEGCQGCDWVSSSPYFAGPHTDEGELPQEEFQALWESINGAGSWAENPWIWAISFKRVES